MIDALKLSLQSFSGYIRMLVIMFMIFFELLARAKHLRDRKNCPLILKITDRNTHCVSIIYHAKILICKKKKWLMTICYRNFWKRTSMERDVAFRQQIPTQILQWIKKNIIITHIWIRPFTKMSFEKNWRQSLSAKFDVREGVTRRLL